MVLSPRTVTSGNKMEKHSNESEQELFIAAEEIRHDCYPEPSIKVGDLDETQPVQARLHTSLTLWSYCADWVETYGTFEQCKNVYDKMIDFKVATPQIIINYGLFLEENKYFEEEFRAYEKGIALFRWPQVYDIWHTYLTKFLQRYGGSKLEISRDLFEKCLENCPPKYAKVFYLLYAKLEEEHGLARHAISVYERATGAVLDEERFEMFNIRIKKAADLYGVPKTREIYEKAIGVLEEENAREMCMRYADMETKLGKVDRARAIYFHCSQFSDPRMTNKFWQTWNDFEVNHGNKDTIREMLKIKCFVQAPYNRTQINLSAQALTSSENNEPTSVMDSLNAATTKSEHQQIMRSVHTTNFIREATVGGASSEPKVVNPEEINIDAEAMDVNDDYNDKDNKMDQDNSENGETVDVSV